MGQRVAWLFVVGGSLFVQGLVTISGILSARLLGVEGRGEVALVVALSGMAAQLTLGGSLPNALTKRLADRATTMRDGVRHLVRTWLLIAVASAIPFAVLFVVLHGDVDSTYVWWLGVMVALLALQNMGFRLVTYGLLGESSPMIRVAIATLLPQTLVTIGIAVLFVVERRASSIEVLLIMVGAFLVGLLVGVRLLAPRRPGAPELDGGDLWRLTRSTYIGSIGPIDGLALDRTLVGALLGTTVLGLYSAASALALLTGTMGSGLATVLLPRIATAQSDPEAERRLVRRWLLVGGLALGGVVALVMLIARLVIEIAFGPAFADAVPVAYWLVAASGLLGFRRILIAVLQGREHGGVASWIEFALTPVLVVGIVAAAQLDSTVAVGQAMLAVAASAVVLLSIAVARTSSARRPPPVRADPDETVADLPERPRVEPRRPKAGRHRR